MAELEKIAQRTRMELVMATLFTFNGPSLAFFHKNGFSTDDSSPDPSKYDYVDHMILSKPVSATKNNK